MTYKIRPYGWDTLHGIGTGTETGKRWVSILRYVLYTLHGDKDRDREPLLPSATVIAERLFYTPVCHSVHRGWCVLHPPRQTPPGKTPPPGRTTIHPVPRRPQHQTVRTLLERILLCPSCSLCRNAKSLYCVGLHWRVPFTEDLSETVQVVW